MKEFKDYLQEKKAADDPCWKGYKQVGMKTKDGKQVPNCVPEADEGVDESDAPTNVTAGVANPDAQPLTKGSFAGYPCLDVDSETYVKCSRGKGKQPYARWKNYVGDKDLEEFIKKNFNKEKKLLIKNRDTGSMTFLK